MDALHLLSQAIEEYYQREASITNPISAEAKDAVSIFIEAMMTRRSVLNRFDDKSGSSPESPEPLFDSLIHLLEFSKDVYSGSYPWPLAPQETAAFVTACVFIEFQRDGMRIPSATTTRSFLSYLKRVYMRRYSKTTPGNYEEDLLLSLKGLVPPSNVDFGRRTLHEPLAALLKSQIIDVDMPWLGVGPHDGHPLAYSLCEYGNMRQGHPNFPWRQNPLLWQSVLSFGLLEGIMDIKIPESFLLHPRPNGQVAVSRMHLSMLLFDWQIRLAFTKLSDPALHKHWVERIETILKEAREIMDDELANRHLVRAGFWQVEVNRQVCSITTLIEAIGHGARLTEYTAGFSPSSSMYIHQARFVNDVKLASVGWCPFSMGAISASMSVMNYATSRRPFIRNQPNEHKDCSAAHCTLHNIDSRTYVAQHATPECACAYVKPPFEHVMELLKRSEVPVMVRDADGNLSVRSASDGPYVAISHVWVDGLGSNTEGGLPGCQVAHMASLSSQLVPDGAFWQDGLCVPDDRPMRKRAIKLMAQTYEQAAKVVVIDAGVRTLCSSRTPLEETLLRIATSGWMQRIWTLQEGLLARELYFELADGLVRAEDLKRSDTAAVDPAFLSFLPIVSALLGALIFDRVDRQVRERTLPDLFPLLHHRTTSKPEDETLALAGLVGVDAGELAELSTAEDRMALFLQRIGKIPRDIIYYPEVKMRKPGFRWAPQTLASGFKLGSSCDAVCTTDGLSAEYWVLAFPKVDLSMPYGNKTFIRDPKSGQHYEVLPSAVADGESRRFNAVLLKHGALPERHTSDSCAAVLIEEDWKMHGLTEKLTCSYVNSSALMGHGDDLQDLLPLLAPLAQGHSVVEGSLFLRSVLVT